MKLRDEQVPGLEYHVVSIGFYLEDGYKTLQKPCGIALYKGNSNGSAGAGDEIGLEVKKTSRKK